MKRKITISIIAILFFAINSFSQNFINAYTNRTAGSTSGSIDRIVTDNMKNVINATMFSGTIVVGGVSYPSNGVLSAMIIKRDDNDSILWSKSLGCGKVVILGGLYTDNQNNIYATGYFGDSLIATNLDCAPFPISNSSGYKSFIIKYSPNGTVLWSNSINIETGNANSNGDLFRITGNGTNRIVVSSFLYHVAPQTIGTSVLDPADGNLFFAEIDNNGIWQYATVFGGTSMHLSLSLAMAANNDLFISGEFKGNLNLGAAGILSTLTSSPQDFVCKANPAGSFVWGMMLESSSWWRTEVLAKNNNVLLFGCFGGSLTLGGTTLTSGTYTTYLTEIDNSGSFLWAKKYGNYETQFYTATRNNNHLFFTGLTSSSFSSNQFDTLNLTYATSLPAANTYSAICYILETDLNGNPLKGACYSLNFPTLNTESMACTDSKTYLTGNALGIAAFGGYVITSVPINSSNYVAVFTDSANIVSGQTYYDFNSNNIFDAGDVNCNTKLTLTKSGNAITTIVNGPYQVGVGTGTYTSTIADAPLYYNYSPSSYTSAFSTLTNQIDSLNDFAFQPITGQNDLVVDLVLGSLRPGFSGNAYATVTNVGTTAKSGSMNVTINHPDITIATSTPAATSIVGNVATLSYNLNPTQHITYLLEYDVSVTAILSSLVIGSASAPDGTDLTPINNFDTIHTVITGSYDPNSKEVYPRGNIAPQFITDGSALEYTIHFQNTGNDTAFTVVLTDTISNKLNLSTFQLVSSSHPVIVNFYENEVWFRFNNINLVDSTTNEPFSHGFVKYKITPKNNCALGDEIKNTAYIFFDFNTAIITNTAITLIANPSGVDEIDRNKNSSVFPNPVNGKFTTVKSKNPISSIEIYDAYGRKLQTINANKAFEIKVATDKLSSGVYFVKIYSGDGVYSEKVVVE
ncbi:MAG: T9SS type A sorting domain-containing protein [Bacteroidetes bacterium]|nr:T9SS type A sorting domain-containing protein [Bacteroidota bacterium]